MIDDLTALIKEQTQIIIILNKYPNEDESKDGYFNRVLFIDDVFSSAYRIYINEDEYISKVFIESISESICQINVPIISDLNQEFILMLRKLADIVYAHSIYAIATKLKQHLFMNAEISVWDIHGVVPEEEAFMGRSKEVVSRFNNIELIAVTHAKIIIGVSYAIISHIKEKYSIYGVNAKFIVLPIIPVSAAKHNLVNKSLDKDPPIVIYSGGLQLWQQLDKMLEFVFNNSTLAKFIFLVTEPNIVIKRYYQLFKTKFPGQVCSVVGGELFHYYKVANFGLVFRESNLINKVASPTKLLDYLSYGIAPILDTAEIGDFLRYGLLFYSKETWSNLFSDEMLFKRLVDNNYKIFVEFQKISQQSVQDLKLSLRLNENNLNSKFVIINDFLKIGAKLLESHILLKQLRLDKQALVNEVNSIYKSKSWKIILPLRKLIALFRK